MRFRKGDIYESLPPGHIQRIIVLEDLEEESYIVKWDSHTNHEVMDIKVMHVFGPYKGRTVHGYCFKETRYIGNDPTTGVLKRDLKKVEI